MDAARWTRIQELFHAAADLRDAAQDAFLAASCAGDADLRVQVGELLAADAAGAPVIDGGAGTLARALLAAGSIAERLGPYRIVRLLGEGGMGVVYLAERTDVGSHVALKLLPDAGLSPERLARFASEQRMLARLEHPAIARLYDAGTSEGTPYFVMEYVAGTPLTDHCRDRAVSIPGRLQLFRALCEAVQFAHQHAVIHRDIKPSNVLVKPDGSLRLLDFGIAKQLEATAADARATVQGPMTPAYAAPEQFLGEPVGVHTDIYALGVVLYELLAGQLPFDAARSAMSVDDCPAPPSIAARRGGRGGAARRAAWAELDLVVLTAMHREPPRRYRSVDALIRDLDHYLRDEPLEARPDRAGYRLRKFVVRHRRAVAASALVVAGLVGVTALFVSRLAVERDRAAHQAAITAAVNRFLAEDFIGRSNPYDSGVASETLLHAIQGAAPDIDRRFAGEPSVAARLHDIIARSLDARGDHDGAGGEYDRAAVLYEVSDGPRSQDAIVAQLRRAGMEARDPRAGALERGRRILAAEERRVAALREPGAGVTVQLDITRGLVALRSNEPRVAARAFELALARTAPSRSDEARLMLQQRLAWAYLRMGDAAKAEAVSHDIIVGFTRLAGPDSPHVYLARQTLVHTLLARRRFAAVLDETRRLYPAFVAMLGDGHPQTLQLLATHAAAESYLERFADAARDELELHRLASRAGPSTLWAVGGLMDAGEAECRDGRTGLGLPHTREARARAVAAFRDGNPGITSAASYALAVCLVAAGAVQEAEQALQAVDVGVMSQMGDAMDYPAAIALLRAEIALVRGDRDTARAQLQAASAFARPDAIAFQRRTYDRLLARVDRRDGAAARPGP